MKFTVNKTALEGAIKAVAPFVGIKSTLPIVENLLFSHEPGTNSIIIEGTDLSRSMQITVDVTELEEPEKAFTIDFKDIQSLISVINMEELSISSTDREVTITTPFYDTYKFPNIDPKEFPTTNYETDEETEFTLETHILKEIIQETSDYTGNDELRPVMNSVFIELDGMDLVATATDAHVLYTKTYKKILEKELHHEFIIPFSSSLVKSIAGHDVRIGVNEKAVIIKNKYQKIMLRLTEGRFPNYKAVIPRTDGVDYNYTIDRKEALEKVMTIAITSNRGTKQVAFKYAEDKLIAISQDLDTNKEGKVTIGAKASTDFEVGYNWSFLQKILKTAIGKEVTIYGSTSKANIIREENEKGTTEATLLIMPVMITN